MNLFFGRESLEVAGADFDDVKEGAGLDGVSKTLVVDLLGEAADLDGHLGCVVAEHTTHFEMSVDRFV